MCGHLLGFVFDWFDVHLFALFHRHESSIEERITEQKSCLAQSDAYSRERQRTRTQIQKYTQTETYIDTISREYQDEPGEWSKGKLRIAQRKESGWPCEPIEM